MKKRSIWSLIFFILLIVVIIFTTKFFPISIFIKITIIAAALIGLNSVINFLNSPRSKSIIYDLHLDPHQVDPPKIDSALDLLSKCIGINKEDLPNEAYRIAEECDYFPLSIVMSGSYLKKYPDNWGIILNYLQTADLDKLLIILPDYKNHNLLKVVHVCFDLLSEADQEILSTLAIFPEDVTIPKDTIITFWNLYKNKNYDAKDKLSDLSDLSFIENKNNEIRILNLIRDYLRKKAEDYLPKLHLRLLESYNVYSKGGGKLNWKKLPKPGDNPYIWNYLFYHLVQADQWKAIYNILTDFEFLETRCSHFSVYDLERDFSFVLMKWAGDPQDNKILSIFADNLRLESHNINASPQLLFTQLYYHLNWVDSAERGTIHKICKAEASVRKNWLRPLHKPIRQEMWEQTLIGHSDIVTDIVITPDGNKIISGSVDNTIKIWDIHSGQLLKTIESHGRILFIAITSDGNKVISGPAHDTIKIWDIHSNKLLKTLRVPFGKITSVAITPDGNKIVSGVSDNSIKIWDIHSYKLQNTLESISVDAIAITPNGDKIVSGDSDNSIKIWDFQSGRLLRILKGHTKQINSIAITPDGNKIVSASWDNTIKIWKISGKLLNTLEGHLGNITSIAITPEGNKIISGSRDKTIKIWDTHSGQLQSSYEGDIGEITSIAVSLDGTKIFTGSTDKTIKVWNIDSFQFQYPIVHTSKKENPMAITPDGNKIISGSYDNTIKIWDIYSGRVVNKLEGHTGWIRSIAISPDGENIISGALDNTIRIWDLHSGQLLRILEGFSGRVDSFAITQDMMNLISFSREDINFWDMYSGKLINTLDGDMRISSNIALTHDGKKIYYGAIDGKIYILDTHSGQLLKSPQGHQGSISSIVITPDGEYIYTSSDDKTIKMWDIHSSQLLGTLEGRSDVIESIAIKSKGKYLLFLEGKKSINLLYAITKEVRTIFVNSFIISSLVSNDSVHWKCVVTYKDSFQAFEWVE